MAEVLYLRNIPIKSLSVLSVLAFFKITGIIFQVFYIKVSKKLMATTEEQVKEIIVRQFEVKPELVKPSASFTDDLKADSLAVVELALAIEQHFGIEIPEEEGENIKTVQEIIDYVTAKVGSNYSWKNN